MGDRRPDKARAPVMPYFELALTSSRSAPASTGDASFIRPSFSMVGRGEVKRLRADQRHDRALQSDHAADKRVDRISSRNWLRLGRDCEDDAWGSGPGIQPVSGTFQHTQATVAKRAALAGRRRGGDGKIARRFWA